MPASRPDVCSTSGASLIAAGLTVHRFAEFLRRVRRAIGSAPRTTTTRALGSVRTRHQSRLKPPIFSGFGQFSIYPLSLREKADGAPFQQRDRPPPAVWKAGRRRGRSRRRHWPARALTKSAIRMAWTATGAPVACTASRRKARLLGAALDKVNARPGVSAKAQAIGIPGKPAPEPRSAQMRASGASVRSWSESAIWRVQSAGSVEGAIKLTRRCHVEQKRHIAIQTIQCFT